MQQNLQKNSQENQHNDVKKFGELIKGIKFAMFTNVSDLDGTLQSRPMTLQQVEFDGHLWFFADHTSEWIKAIQAIPKVNLAFANPNDNSYVSASGQAEVVHDKKKAAELWNPMYKAWFPEGLEDPDLCLVKVHVEAADYWDSPNGKLVTMLGFAKAVITGKRIGDEVSDRGHLTM